MVDLEQQLAAQEAKYSEANTTLEAELERLRADGFEQVIREKEADNYHRLG